MTGFGAPGPGGPAPGGGPSQPAPGAQPPQAQAQCAEHPDLPATAGTCDRCGTYMCGACLSPSVDRRMCLRCYDRVVGRGRAHHLPTLGLLTIINGALMAALGLLNVLSYILVLGVMAGAPDSRDMPDEAQGLFFGVMAGVGLLSVAVHLVPGVLQIWSGWQMRQRRGRTLALVALSSGLASLLGCYCFPTSLGLFIWGLMVLLDDSTKEVMATNEER